MIIYYILQIKREKEKLIYQVNYFYQIEFWIGLEFSQVLSKT